MNMLRTPLSFVAFVALFAAFSAPLARGQEGAAIDLIALEDEAMKAAVAKAAPAVLRIETLVARQKVDEVLVDAGPTTGLAVSPDGYVLTSAFAFAQAPQSILVTLPSGKRAAAKIVARDRSRMLVLLKVQTDEPLPTLALAPRDSLRVGQWTLALGRSFDSVNGEGLPAVSVGVLSAANRIWGKAVQTDAKISPANYGGPLIDLAGRAIGILTPLSPTEQGEAAGAEWYDSGIGFAVPLDDVLLRLDEMKAGEDLHPGLLGISLKGNDIYVDAPIVASAPVKSPAAKAGLQAGDQIVEVDGQGVERQAQLKHLLGPRYAGDKVRLAVLRDGARIEAEIELAEKIEPYSHPFLGVLPKRDRGEEARGDDSGIVVRYVYPGSPADEADIVAGDVLQSIDGKPIPTALAARELLAAYEPGAEIKVSYSRGDENREAELTLAALPDSIPDQLPPAEAAVDAAAEAPAGTGVVAIKLPEEANECLAYIPESYRADAPHGLIVWLQAPGSFQQDELIDRWRDHCRDSQFILLAPRPLEDGRWSPTEVEFVGKAIDDVVAKYNIDRARIVVHGHQAGGAIGWLVAFDRRDLVRGVAAVDASLPIGFRPGENDPARRLAVYITQAEKSKLAEAVQSTAETLRAMKFPVTVKNLDQPRYLNDEEVAELIRWADALDRL
jgi:S1-C subfamily serine protease/predicted esterase